MTVHSVKIAVEVGGVDDGGAHEMRVLRGDSLLWADRVVLADAEARGDFIRRAREEYPGLSEEALSKALLDAVRTAGGTRVHRPSSGRTPKRTPFPVEVLPPVLRRYCETIARGRCVDISVPGLFVLVAASSAIGGGRSAYDSFADWTEPSALWGALVMGSGTRKSIVLEDAFWVHYERQDRKFTEFEAAKAQHQAELDEWKLARRRKDAESVPRPPEPKPEHIFTADATTEAVIDILSSTPRGIAVPCDELSGFFGSLGRYSGSGPEKDRAVWLSTFRGLRQKVDRVSRPPIWIRNGLTSVVGGVQPSIMKKALSEENVGSGLMARFLLVMPEPMVKEYKPGLSAEDRREYGALINRLFDLKMEPYLDDAGEVAHRTQRVGFAPECRAYLDRFVPEWSEESMALEPSVEAAMSKLEGYCYRFALLLRMIREVEGGARSEEPITLADLEAGVILATWFKEEAVRVYRTLGASEGSDTHRDLATRIARIARRGGAVTVNEWVKANTRVSSEEARRQLQELVDAHLATWQPRPPGPNGGRPTEECALCDSEGDDGAREPVESDPRDGVEVSGVDGEASGVSSPGNGRNADSGAGPPTSAQKGRGLGYGLWRYAPPEHDIPLLGGKKGGDPFGEVPVRAESTPETSDGEEVNSPAGRCRRSAGGYPHNLNLRNPSEPVEDVLVVADPPPSADQADAAFWAHVEAMFGADEAPDGGLEVVPWDAVSAKVSGPSACWNCSSVERWRLRDAGRGEPGDWRCAGCTTPKIDERFVERDSGLIPEGGLR